MKLGIIIYSNRPETVWNAFRFGNFSIKKKDQVRIFLLGEGVEFEKLDNEKFKISEQAKIFSEAGGLLYACGTCVKIREGYSLDSCPISTMEDLYSIINESDKVLSF